MPQVLNKYTHGTPPGSVVVMRPTKWGNPYSNKPFAKGVHWVSTREQAVEKYREWIATQPELLASLGELRGRDLVCCCVPQKCHASVLLELANPPVASAAAEVEPPPPAAEVQIEDAEQLADGYVICADSTQPGLVEALRDLIGEVPLIIADPPYGNVVAEAWDRVNESDEKFSDWMVAWTRLWETMLLPGGALYCWGGIGTPGFRPFFKYLAKAERPGEFELANLITWKKKRAYGVQHNYLFTREECAYFVRGDAKKPRKFCVPLLEEKRAYPGYDKNHPALSEYYRRTNVWTDVTEILRGKLHPTQKAQRVVEVPIEVHTEPGEWVLDPFAGAGTTAQAARKLGRRFVVIERDKECFEGMVGRLR